jgi:hypothetical protein
MGGIIDLSQVVILSGKGEDCMSEFKRGKEFQKETPQAAHQSIWRRIASLLYLVNGHRNCNLLQGA